MIVSDNEESNKFLNTSNEDCSLFSNKSELVNFSQLDKSQNTLEKEEDDKKTKIYVHLVSSTAIVIFTTKFDMNLFQKMKKAFPIIFKIKYPDEFFNGVYNRKYHSIIGLEKNSKELICFSQILFNKTEKTVEIITIGVLSEFQGKGFGNLLIVKVIEELKMAGINEVSLIVQNTNTPAVNLYLKNGFTVDLTLENYYSMGNISENKALIMKKILKESGPNDSIMKIKNCQKKNIKSIENFSFFARGEF